MGLIRALFVAAVIAGLSAGIGGSAAAYPAGAASAATLDQLAAIQTLLRVEIDGTRICREFEGLDPTAIATLPQMLEAEVQAKLGAFSPLERKTFFADENRMNACAARCRCGLYANWLDSVPELAGVRAKLLARESKSAPNGAAYVACARANRAWICRHPVVRGLVKGAKELSVK